MAPNAPKKAIFRSQYPDRTRIMPKEGQAPGVAGLGVQAVSSPNVAHGMIRIPRIWSIFQCWAYSIAERADRFGSSVPELHD